MGTLVHRLHDSNKSLSILQQYLKLINISYPQNSQASAHLSFLGSQVGALSSLILLVKCGTCRSLNKSDYRSLMPLLNGTHLIPSNLELIKCRHEEIL
jgi:hypothetical protein